VSGRTFHTSEIAVALQYDGKNAPKITAKGEGFTARQILEIAEEHGVPLQYEPELAGILAYVPLGEEIPQQLYIAVAEVIAFAYFISGKTPNPRS
jgi:flagellar biosynthesis protein